MFLVAARVWRMALPVLLAVGVAVHPARAQDDAGQVVMIPMRDGVHLRTTLWFPEGDGPWPVVLEKTQSDEDSHQGRTFAEYYETGVVWAVQNARGRYGSEGAPVPVYDTDGWGTLQDGYDTCAWLVDQPWCNGRIGTIGGSARGGFAHFLSAVDPPGLEAVYIRDGLANLWESILFTGGAWRVSDSGWYRRFGDITRLYDHHAFDAFWEQYDTTSRSNSRDHPTMFEVGWFDAYRQGSLHAWRDLQIYGTARARRTAKLALEARGHIQSAEWFSIQPWPEHAAVPPTSYQGRALFDHYLKGIANGFEGQPKVTYYLLGNVDNIETGPGPAYRWHGTETWPPAVDWVPLFLDGNGRLRTRANTGKPTNATYLYDPRDPVPTIGGSPVFGPKPGMFDQQSIEARDDVLTFTSVALPAPVEVTGPIRASLYVSSDQVDTDFVVKITDVYPDGRSMTVTDGIVRASFRDSLRDPELMTPGEIYRVDVHVWDIGMLFDAGHRIRVTVTSSNHARFQANPNSGEGPGPGPFDSRVALNTLYFTPTRSSHIVLPVRERSNAAALWDGDDETAFTIRPEDTTGYCGEETVVPITASHGGARERFEFDLIFDPMELSVEEVVSGPAGEGLFPLYSTELAPGWIKVEGNATALIGAGTATIARLRVRPLVCDRDTWIVVSTPEEDDGQQGLAGKITSVDPSRLLPSVALNGALQMTVACGDAFQDPGARASDPQDGNLTDEVQISGTVETGTPGTYTLDYTVADEDGNVSNVAQRILEVVDNIPPRIVLYGPETLQVACGDVYDDPGAFAEDACDSAVSIEVDASAVDMATPGTYTVRYTGVDGSGSTGTATRTVVVADTTAPMITGTGLEDVRFVCGRLEDPVVSAVDGCDGPVSVTVGGAVDINVPGTYTQTFTATDTAGNAGVATRTVTIILAGAPTMTLMGEADLTLECGDSFLDPGAVGTDACDRPLTVRVSGDIPTPLRVGTYERRYYGRDENDLFAFATRTVTVVDTRPPDVRLKGLHTVRLECGDSFVDPGATALDDCTGPAGVAVSGNLNIRRAGTYTLTYSAEDLNGNVGTATREIIVADTTAPVISLRGEASVEVACGGDWIDPGATASDSCGGPVTVTQTPESVDLNTPGTSTITYTAEDASGNRASVTRTVAVLPCEIPEGEGAMEGMTDPDLAGWAARLIDRFDDRDANGDGLLTFEEIVAGEQGFTREVFDLLDKDGSGALTEGELMAQIAPTPPATGCACMDNAEKTFRSVAGDLLLLLISLSIAVLIGRVGRSEG